MMKLKTKLKLQVEQELCLITLTNIEEINSYVDEGSGFVMDHNIELKRIIINEQFFCESTRRKKKRTIGKCTFYHIIFNRDFAALFALIMSNDCIYFTLKLSITLKVYYAM